LASTRSASGCAGLLHRVGEVVKSCDSARCRLAYASQDSGMATPFHAAAQRSSELRSQGPPYLRGEIRINKSPQPSDIHDGGVPSMLMAGISAEIKPVAVWPDVLIPPRDEGSFTDCRWSNRRGATRLMGTQDSVPRCLPKGRGYGSRPEGRRYKATVSVCLWPCAAGFEMICTRS